VRHVSPKEKIVQQELSNNNNPIVKSRSIAVIAPQEIRGRPGMDTMVKGKRLTGGCANGD
jgi:hypothetical protein